MAGEFDAMAVEKKELAMALKMLLFGLLPVNFDFFKLIAV